MLGPYSEVFGKGRNFRGDNNVTNMRGGKIMTTTISTNSFSSHCILNLEFIYKVFNYPRTQGCISYLCKTVRNFHHIFTCKEINLHIRDPGLRKTSSYHLITFYKSSCRFQVYTKFVGHLKFFR